MNNYKINSFKYILQIVKINNQNRKEKRNDKKYEKQ